MTIAEALLNQGFREKAEMPVDTENLVPHLIVEARAGTGKTTTLIEGLKRIKGIESSMVPSPQQEVIWQQMELSRDARTVCFVAFNKAIASELQSRVPADCEAMTMHSMGFKAVQAAYGRLAVNQYRVQDIISEITGRDIRELRRFKPVLVKATEDLVGLCKMNLRTGTAEDCDELARHYDIDCNGPIGEIFALVPQVIERCKDVAKDCKIDFDDMVWLPVVLNLSVAKYDLLLVDESQDLNRCQQALAKKAGERLILVGDSKQAIYGFAGADSQSMSRMFEELKDAERGCNTLPLTVTRRCGRAIVVEANRIVADFHAHETNCEGKVTKGLKYADDENPVVKSGEEVDPGHDVDGAPIPVVKGKPNYRQDVQDGDMLLCRVNAPLVSQCFKFLRAGRKATIQGRDVGQGLISTVKKLKADTLVDLVSKLSDWLHNETQKENAKRNPNENRLISLQDRFDCLMAFTEDQTTVEGVIARIEVIFTDDRKNAGVKLSSIHKAKGLEANRIYFLMPKGGECPHPMAKSQWQKEQESNLLYVGITRAIEELYFVY